MFNNYNGYGGYNSNPFFNGNGYYQPQQPMMYQNQYEQQVQQPMQQPRMQSQATQPITLPLILLNSFEEVQKFIIGLNQVVYLKCNDKPNIIFEKKTDNAGNTSLIALKTTQIDINNSNNNIDIPNQNISTNELASKNDLKALQEYFTNSMINLSNELLNAFKSQINANYNDNRNIPSQNTQNKQFKENKERVNKNE